MYDIAPKRIINVIFSRFTNENHHNISLHPSLVLPGLRLLTILIGEDMTTVHTLNCLILCRHLTSLCYISYIIRSLGSDVIIIRLVCDDEPCPGNFSCFTHDISYAASHLIFLFFFSSFFTLVVSH